MNKFLPFVIILIIFNIIHMTQFFPPNEDFKRAVEQALNEILPQKMYDVTWNDYWHYFEPFASAANVIDGAHGTAMTYENTGQASVTLDGWEVAVEASITAASFMQKVQIPTLGGSGVGINRNLSWSQQQRFRANFSYSGSAASPQFTAYLVRGATPQSSYNHPNFGFKIVNGSLRGIARNSSAAEGSVILATLSKNTAYVVEARYFPGDKVIYFLQNNSTLKMEEAGVLRTNLPTPSNANVSTFFGMEITRANNETVQFLGSFFEYQQKQRRF